MSIRLVIWRQVCFYLLHVESFYATVANRILDSGQLSLRLVLTHCCSSCSLLLLLLWHLALQNGVHQLLLLLLLLLSELLFLDLIPLLACHSFSHSSSCCRGHNLLLTIALIQLFLCRSNLRSRYRRPSGRFFIMLVEVMSYNPLCKSVRTALSWRLTGSCVFLLTMLLKLVFNCSRLLLMYRSLIMRLMTILLELRPSVLDDTLTHQALCRFLCHSVIVCRVSIRLSYLNLFATLLDLNLKCPSIMVSLTRLWLLIYASWRLLSGSLFPRRNFDLRFYTTIVKMLFTVSIA